MKKIDKLLDGHADGVHGPERHEGDRAMRVFKRVSFKCSRCGKELTAKGYTPGERVTCPYCTKEMKLRVRAAPPREAQLEAPRRQVSDDKGVPIKVGLGNAASFETTVSKKDAGRMGHTVLGGMLVAGGVILCAILGINYSHRA